VSSLVALRVGSARRVCATAFVVCVLLAGCALLAGCGGISAPDLFIVKRTGSGPHAKLTLLVNEEGGVHCNGVGASAGHKLKLSDPALVEARAIQEDLEEPSADHVSLAPGADFGESFICARAGFSEAAVRPIRQSRSARIRHSSKENRDLLSNPAQMTKKKAARRRPSMSECAGGPAA